MSTARLFADNVYESIRTTWEWARNRPNANHGIAAPSVATLAALIDPAFRASIQREENEDVHFSVVKHDKTVAQPGRIFLFGQQLNYTERNLKKLAGAFDRSTGALLVEAGTGDPIIWGFGYFGTNFLRHLPVGTGYESGWPSELMLRASSPGVIAIARAGSSLGVLEYGVFTPPTPTPLTQAAMGSRLLALISRDPTYSKYPNASWHMFSRTLEQLLRTINRVSHGATLVLVPTSYKAELGPHHHAGFMGSGSFQMAELLVRQHTTTDPLFSAALSDRLTERINAIARLACVDGALLVTTEFEVLGFGVKLKAPPWSGRTVVGPDGFRTNGQMFDLSKLGTRHNSAASVVMACSNVIAFVSSTDGPIRGFARDAQSLVCWPDFRASMFTHDTH